ICDSNISVISPKGKLLVFKTDHMSRHPFKSIAKPYSVADKSYMVRTIFRNALSPKGKKLGYGVVTGEPSAEPYARFGKRKLHRGELVVFATDGFEDYLQLPAFRDALLSMDKRVIEDAMAHIKDKNNGARPFASERTLIAIRME